MVIFQYINSRYNYMYGLPLWRMFSETCRAGSGILGELITSQTIQHRY